MYTPAFLLVSAMTALLYFFFFFRGSSETTRYGRYGTCTDMYRFGILCLVTHGCSSFGAESADRKNVSCISGIDIESAVLGFVPKCTYTSKYFVYDTKHMLVLHEISYASNMYIRKKCIIDSKPTCEQN